MAKAPAARPADGAELARRIEALQAGATPVSAPTLALSSQSTPAPGPRRAAKWVGLTVAATVLAVIAGLLWRYLPAPEHSAPVVAPAPADAARAAGKSSESSIAVLPLRNEGGAAEDVYFSDGLSEDLITALGQLEGVRVISRNSSFRFRDANEASERIAGQLGVDYLVEGSVRRGGDAVRLNISLVRANDGSTAWSQRFDRPYRDLFALQDEIVDEVTRALGSRLRVAPVPDVFDRKSGGGGSVIAAGSVAAQRDKPPSGNMAAYEALLRGNHELVARNRASAGAAIARYEEAVRLDPDYARAWAQLALARYALANFYEVEVGLRGRLNAASTEAAKTALRLDPQLAQAHQAMAVVLRGVDRDFAGAEREQRRALELAPQDPAILARLASLLSERGQLEEALATARRAVLADPLSAPAHELLGRVLFTMRRYRESESALLESVRLRPQGAVVRATIAVVRVFDGRLPEALDIARQEVDPFWRTYALAVVHDAAGRTRESAPLLARLEREHSDDAAFQIAEIYARRGDRDRAFRWLERALQVGDAGVVGTRSDPFFASLAGDPRFEDFCRRAGLPPPPGNSR
jgi:serine/threonine-protein kinase